VDNRQEASEMTKTKTLSRGQRIILLNAQSQVKYKLVNKERMKRELEIEIRILEEARENIGRKLDDDN
jgi:hypothetical protein